MFHIRVLQYLKRFIRIGALEIWELKHKLSVQRHLVNSWSFDYHDLAPENFFQRRVCTALLSQTGEFGILALSVAYRAGIIENGFYKEGLGITSLSLLLSTIWIGIVNNILSVSLPTKKVNSILHYNKMCGR